MGNVFSGSSWSRDLAESCLNTLQEQGLCYFQSKTFGLNYWKSTDVFGVEQLRNQSFEHVRDLLAPLIKAGFREAKISDSKINLKMEWFIRAAFSHYIMSGLLKADATEISLQDIKEGSLGFYVLPDYAVDKVADFQKKWLVIPQKDSNPEQIISLETTDTNQKALLSAKLADEVCQLIQSSNIKDLVKDSLLYFKQQKSVENLAKTSLFKQAGMEHMLASGTDSEEESDSHEIKVM